VTSGEGYGVAEKVNAAFCDEHLASIINVFKENLESEVNLGASTDY